MGDSGTVTFGAGVDFTISAGANAVSAVSKTTTEYASNHNAAYVKIEENTAPV